MKTLNEIIGLPAALQIALVTETYLPEVNGVAITIGRMVDGLRQRGHVIYLIRPRQHKRDVATEAQNYHETLMTDSNQFKTFRCHGCGILTYKKYRITTQD